MKVVSLSVARKFKTFYAGGPLVLSRNAPQTEADTNTELDTRHPDLICACVDEVSVCDMRSGTFESLEGDEEMVAAIAARPNSSQIVVASRSLQMSLWDLTCQKTEKSRVNKRWKAHEAPVLCMDFDPSSVILATGSADATIRCWDIERHFCTHHFKGHSGLVTALHFHPQADRWLLFSGGEDGTVRVWDLIKKSCVAVLRGHASVVKSLQVTPCGWQLMSAGRDKVVNIWNLRDFSLVRTMPTFEVMEAAGLLTGAELGEEANEEKLYFYTGGDKGHLRIWDFETGKLIKDVNEGAVTAVEITHVLYDKIGGQLIVSTMDQRLIYYSLNGLTVAKELIGTFDEVLDLRFTGVGSRTLVVANPMEDVRLLPIDTDNFDTVQLGSEEEKEQMSLNAIPEVRPLKGHTKTIVCIDADTHCSVEQKHFLLATGSKDKTGRVWLMDQADESMKIDCIGECVGHAESISAISLSHPSRKVQEGESLPSAFVNRFMITASADRTIKKWDIGALWQSIKKGGRDLTRLKSSFTVKAHDKDINSVSISPNNKIIATASQDKTVRLWDVESGSVIGTLKGHRRGIWSVVFSPVDQIVATSSGDKTVKIWSLTDHSCLKTFEGHTSSVLKVEFMCDGTQLLSTGSDGLAKVWDIKSGECILTLDNHEDKVWAAAIRHGQDSTQDVSKKCMVATGSSDSSIALYIDTTSEKLQEEQERQEKTILEEQALSNHVVNREFVKAVKLALRLGKSVRCAQLIQHVLDERSGQPDEGSVLSPELDAMVQELGESTKELSKLLTFVRDWNTHAKFADVAQAVLYLLLTKLDASRLLSLPDIKPTIDALIPYTERHFSRTDQLLTKSWLLDYTLREMDVYGAFEETPEQ